MFRTHEGWHHFSGEEKQMKKMVSAVRPSASFFTEDGQPGDTLGGPGAVALGAPDPRGVSHESYLHLAPSKSPICKIPFSPHFGILPVLRVGLSLDPFDHLEICASFKGLIFQVAPVFCGAVIILLLLNGSTLWSCSWHPEGLY